MNYQYNYNNQNMPPYGGYPQGFYPQGPSLYEVKAEKKRISAVSIACGLAVIGFLALSVIIGAVMGRVYPDFGRMIEEDTLFIEGFTMISSVFLIGGPFFLAYLSLKKRGIQPELPLGRPYDKREFLLLIPIGLMICIIGSLATTYFAELVDFAFGIEFEAPDDFSDYQSVWGVLVSLISTAAIPAFIEEFAIRGVVMQSLRRYGEGFAIVMSSLVFALMHGNMIQIPFAFIAGIGIGYAVIRTGSMWTGVIIHFLNNSIAVFSMVAYSNLSENGMAVFTAILYITVFIIGIICLIQLKNKTRGSRFSLQKSEVPYLTTGQKTGSFLVTVPMILAIIALCVETAQFINV